jgi:hypothetical protein
MAMFDPQNPEMMELSRQRKMADLLLARGMETPQGQTVAGGVYVPPNPLKYLANLYSTYKGSEKNKDLDQKEIELAQKLRELGVTETQGILGTLKGTPEVSTELAGPAYQGVTPTAVMPAKAGDANAALAQALMGQSPQAQRLIPSLIEQANPKPIAEQIKYNLAKEGGYKGTFNEFINQMSEADKARIAIDKQRLGLEGARLNLEQQKVAQELNAPKLTETQSNATAFGMRAKESNQLLNELEKSGTKNTGITRSAISGLVGMTPFIGDKLEQGVSSAMNVLPGALGGPNEAQQATDQARRNFVTAVLRKESGAAISPSEFANESQKYFPQPGDAPSVVKQKQDARELAIKALETQAGPGAKYIKESTSPQATSGGWSVKSVK